MKTVFKLALVKAILFLMTSSVAAQTSSNAYVIGTVFAGGGSGVEVDVFRSQDSTGLITTELFYNSCPQTTNVGCQQGVGVIPNAAFQGAVFTNPSRPDVVTLLVDTNAVAGFRNYICINDEFFYCAIQSPTSGGVVSMSWTRSNAYSSLNSELLNLYQSGKLASTENHVQSEFSAVAAGTFFGALITGPVSPLSVRMGTADNSQTLKTKFAALKGGH